MRLLPFRIGPSDGLELESKEWNALREDRELQHVAMGI